MKSGEWDPHQAPAPCHDHSGYQNNECCQYHGSTQNQYVARAVARHHFKGIYNISERPRTCTALVLRRALPWTLQASMTNCMGPPQGVPACTVGHWQILPHCLPPQHCYALRDFCHAKRPGDWQQEAERSGVRDRRRPAPLKECFLRTHVGGK